MLLEELVHEKENGEKYVKGRELHEYLGLKKRFSAWIEQYITQDNKYGFEEKLDFTSVLTSTLVNNGAKRELQDYELTLNMAKEISMITGTDKGREARRYFIDCEKYIIESNQSPEFEYFRKTGKILRKDLTNTIKNIMKPENKFVYSNFTNLVYLKVFGKKAKELKEERGLKKNDNLRDNLTPKELEEVAKIEKQVDSCITFFDMQGVDKSEYYSRIKELLGIK